MPTRGPQAESWQCWPGSAPRAFARSPLHRFCALFFCLFLLLLSFLPSLLTEFSGERGSQEGQRFRVDNGFLRADSKGRGESRGQGGGKGGEGLFFWRAGNTPLPLPSLLPSPFVPSKSARSRLPAEEGPQGASVDPKPYIKPIKPKLRGR